LRAGAGLPVPAVIIAFDMKPEDGGLRRHGRTNHAVGEKPARFVRGGQTVPGIG